VDRRLELVAENRMIRRSQLGVSENAFYIASEEVATHSGDTRELICAGRLDWIKGLDLAIEALSLLPTEYRLRIVGKGPAESSLRALATSMGVISRVTIEPPVPRSALSVLYAQADLFLFTSAEVAGLVWVEALASGLPVVAFDGETEVAAAARYLPGIHLAVAGQRRCENVQRFADAIKAAADAPRDPDVLRTATLQQYGWDGLVATIREAYCAAMEANR
jgi:glycosyltransferase involved in cell wall biosynthesis